MRRVAVSLALGFVATGCCETGSDPETLLVVQAAQQQPSRDDHGIIVVIQSLGGTWIEVQVASGTLANGSGGICLRAPVAEPIRMSTTDVLVYPDQTEAVVTVALYPDATRMAPASSDSGADSGGTLGPCRIDERPLQQVIRPVQRLNAATPAGTGGSSGLDGAPGTGGAAMVTDAKAPMMDAGQGATPDGARDAVADDSSADGGQP